ncbi:MAG TPA: hypothetical protein VL361_03095 [Candidatus Limnocylindrales bacterium]|nr:hypothetical protein [Candidatus Limnocylindrales bacterium]
MAFCPLLAGVKLPAQNFHCPEFLEGMEQPGLDGSNRAAECRGDTFEGIVDVKPQVDHLLMLWREDLDAFLHEQCPFAKFDHLVGQELRIADVSLRLKFHIRRIELVRKRRPPFVPKNIAEAVEQNGAKPGEELAFAAITRQAAPGLDESFLSQIFRKPQVATQGKSLSQKARFEKTAHLAERLGIARASLLEQARKVLGIQFHGR